MSKLHKNQINLILLAITFLAAVFFGIPLISGEYLRGWDAPTHIFFSSGYLNGWWNIWEPRWYGGYSKASYPPLSHQLIAIMTHLAGDLKLSYELVAWAFLSIAPFAAYRFSKSFVDEKSSIIAALLFVFLPSVRLTVFVFGQFAGFVGLVFLLLSVGAIGDFLRTGKKSAGIVAACLVACSVASHHNTAIFLLPPVLIVTTIAQFEEKKCTVKCFAVRSAIIWAACAFAALIVIFPFWVWLLDFKVQEPIPHPSRENFFKSLYPAQIFFLDIYGPLLILIPFIIARIIKERIQMPLTAAYMFFMILGLGGTTPLPSLIYGVWWQWLTFERFEVWATVLLLPLAGQFILKMKSKALFYIVILMSVLLVFLALFWLIDPSKQRITPSPIELDLVFKSFADYPICEERYLALGFHYQFPDFSTYTNAKTLDGMFHTARSDPLLRNSGIGSLGDALSWDNGKNVLKRFLSRQIPVPAYCIFINETSPEANEYKDIIIERGWKLKEKFSNKVSLWMNDNISKIQITGGIKRLSRTDKFYGYLWGILPLSFFFIAIFMNIIDNPLPYMAGFKVNIRRNFIKAIVEVHCERGRPSSKNLLRKN